MALFFVLLILLLLLLALLVCIEMNSDTSVRFSRCHDAGVQGRRGCCESSECCPAPSAPNQNQSVSFCHLSCFAVDCLSVVVGGVFFLFFVFVCFVYYLLFFVFLFVCLFCLLSFIFCAKFS